MDEQQIKKICDLANKLHDFSEDDSQFLDAIKSLDRAYLIEERDKFKENSIAHDNTLKPVNFIKFIVLDKLLNGENLSVEKIDEFKNKLVDLDSDYFKEYPTFKEPMLKKKRGKNFFHSWNNLFKTLFYIFYDQYKDEVKDILTDFANYLKEQLNMMDSKLTVNGFDWNNNFGTDRCWIALYPNDRENHQKAYQIFIGIYPNLEIKYGMMPGSELRENIQAQDEDKLQTQDSDSLNLENIVSFLINEAKPLYEKLNSQLANRPSDIKPDVIEEQFPKNIILYGPPGTGKTYITYERAVKIVDPSFSWDKREDLVKRFRELQDNGYITFVTFHQSYSYEEFIEGFRYDEDEKIPIIEPGVFKTLVESAKTDYVKPSKATDLNIADHNVFKMSLGDTSMGDDIYDYCIEKNVISLGWGQSVDYSEASNKEKISKKFAESSKIDSASSYNITAIHCFKNIMKKGDLVFISKGNLRLRAIGKITGDYNYNDASSIDYNHFRKVDWLYTDVSIPVEKLMKKRFSQATIYEIKKSNLLVNNLRDLLSQKENNSEKIKNYVIIIDEINRGNLSKIFGELITLIEDDKRLGMENEMVVKLPYSKVADFGIPPNIYIIGTMNTADRSIALMDVALRRRFSFKRIDPDLKIIEDILDARGISADFIENLQKSIQILNKRIRILLDEDHLIGHSYFLRIDPATPEYDLHAVWYNKIIPLLQEYFYNDWDKLQMVLGKYNLEQQSGFVRVLQSEYKNVFDSEFDEEWPSEIVYYKPDSFSQVLKKTFLK
jgi:5-methylcytosine-specific restriction protein B